MARPPIPVLAGDRFGRLTVIRDRDGKDPKVLVACECGSPPKAVYVSELRRRSNPLRSCGCGSEIGWAKPHPRDVAARGAQRGREADRAAGPRDP